MLTFIPRYVGATGRPESTVAEDGANTHTVYRLRTLAHGWGFGGVCETGNRDAVSDLAEREDGSRVRIGWQARVVHVVVYGVHLLADVRGMVLVQTWK